MTRAIVIACALVLATGATNAQAQGTPKEHSACRADAKKFCKSSLTGGPFAVGACLAFNKTKLTAKCRAVLVSHGM